MKMDHLFKVAIRGPISGVFNTYGKYVMNSLVKIGTLPKEKAHTFNLIVQPSFCRKDATTGKNYLSTSVILAIFDQLSSVSFIYYDQQHRAGASILLDTESLTDVIEPGEEIIVKTIGNKIGKFVGFSTIELRSLQGKLLAHGTHTKFMPQGRIWDLITLPFLKPIAIPAIYNYYDKKMSGPLDPLFRKSEEDTHTQMVTAYHQSSLPTLPIGSLFTALQLQTLPPTTTSSTGSIIYHYTMKVHADLENGNKVMHGGAIAVAIEEACYRSRGLGIDTDNDAAIDATGKRRMKISKMELRYLAACQKEIIIDVQDEEGSHSSQQQLLQQGLTSKSVGVVKNKKNGLTNVEFTCTWQLL